MKKFQLTNAFLAISFLAFAIGCGPGTQTADNDSSSNSSATAGEHVHADGTTHKDHSQEGHAHGAGPHDGTIADWGGGKFHVEFTVDHDKQEATAYVLGGDEKTPTPIDAKEITLTIKEPSLSIALKASPQDGDPEGKASRFIGDHEGLGEVREYEGSMSGVVAGTPYSGNFKEEAHDH